MIVMKFGGTSVQDAVCMDQALDIVLDKIDQQPIVISSAMAKMTDSLIALGNLAKEGNREQAAASIKAMVERHKDAANHFLTGSNLEKCLEQLTALGEELRSSVKGLCILKQCNMKALDSILSFGELLSTTILAFRIKERGFDSTWLDSRKLVKTDSNYGSANVNFEQTNRAIQESIVAKKNHVYVAQGFIGSTACCEEEKDITTTLGRGGSDYSAAIFGAAIDAKEIQIWTDVNGIMTTDPRIVPTAKTIEKITYEEAAELAFFGAKVVHPATIQPAIGKNIPVTVLNTKDAKGPYTTIGSEKIKMGLKAIAGKKNITLININSSRMFNAYGFLSRIFSIFEKYKTSVDLISTSEVSVSLTIDNTLNLTPIVEELEKIATVKVEYDKSILCMVGQDLWRDPQLISRAFRQLTQIPIRMISLGSSDTNLSFVLPGEKLNEAIKEIHSEFFN